MTEKDREELRALYRKVREELFAEEAAKKAAEALPVEAPEEESSFNQNDYWDDNDMYGSDEDEDEGDNPNKMSEAEIEAQIQAEEEEKWAQLQEEERQREDDEAWDELLYF